MLIFRLNLQSASIQKPDSVACNQHFLMKSVAFNQHIFINSVVYNQQFCIFAGKIKTLLWKHYL